MAGEFCFDEGQGPAIILIHGVGLDHTMWLEHAGSLIERGWRVMLPDLIGHGRTPPITGELTLAHLTGQIERVLDERDVQSAVVAGFSLGALVARALALRCPERLSHLVLLNGVYGRTEAQRAAVRARYDSAREQGLGALIEGAFERWFTPDFARSRPDVLAAVRDRLSNNTPAGFLPAYRLFIEAGDEPAEALRGFTRPVLVITGENDVGSTPAMSELMAEFYPVSELDVLMDAKHMLPVENVGWLVERITKFVADHGGVALRED